MFTATFLSLPLALIKAHLARSQTCFSTYDVGNNNTNNCYGLEYANDTEASIIDFTESVVRAQIQYPTYTWLSNAGITPSNSTGYNLTSIQSVLTKASGAVPYVRIGDCDHVLHVHHH
jgi:ribonuclease T2